MPFHENYEYLDNNIDNEISFTYNIITDYGINMWRVWYNSIKTNQSTQSINSIKPIIKINLCCLMIRSKFDKVLYNIDKEDDMYIEIFFTFFILISILICFF